MGKERPAAQSPTRSRRGLAKTRQALAVHPRSPERPRGVLTRQEGKRFRLNRLLPAEPLREAVEHYWIVEWDLRGQPDFVAETLPHPSVHLVLEPGRCRVLGVTEGKFTRVLTGAGRVFGVKFRPGGFHALLGAPVSTLTNRSLPLRRVFGRAGDAFAAAVLAVPGDAARADRADAFLLPRVAPLTPAARAARDAVARIGDDREIVRVEDAARLLGGTVRGLQRRFRRYVGVSPKWVIRRYRLHEAAERLASGEGWNGPRLAAELGYFDQAHFIRDFKAVIGVAPAQYAQRLRVEG